MKKQLIFAGIAILFSLTATKPLSATQAQNKTMKDAVNSAVITPTAGICRQNRYLQTAAKAKANALLFDSHIDKKNDIDIYALNDTVTIQGYIGERTLVYQAVPKESNVPNHEAGCKSDKKTHMSYHAIKAKNTPQYRLQEIAYTDPESGIRRIDDCYLVAVGSYYADHIGQRLLVTMESGQQVHCMVGEFKSNRHTDSSHRYHVGGEENGIIYPPDGSVLEFVVDTSIYTTKKIPDIFAGRIHRIDAVDEV